MDIIPSISNKQINRAGGLLRDWWVVEDGNDFDQAELEAALATVTEYRAGFEYPLNMVTVGIRQFVERESSPPITVAQRLKRVPTILDKLNRQPTMKLTTMGDIGGCRAILRDESEIRRVVGRVTRNWTVPEERQVRNVVDYIEEPRATGYRAIHILAKRKGRLVEIQLRTTEQHDWATAVDRHSARLRRLHGFNLKDGDAPPELVRYFERAAYAIDLLRRGERVDDAFEEEFASMRERVRPFFAKDG